jgi:DNA-binding IclR family transcriptional regulator
MLPLKARILRILRSASGSGHYYVDRLQRDLKVPRATLDAALRDMEQHGGVEFTGTSGLYVRATGRWFTEAA